MPASRRSYQTMAFILLSLGQLMCILDISIVNIAIPSIQRELSLPSASLHWIVTAYVLTYAGLLLVGGRLGDLFGRRRMFLFGLTMFTLASAVGGMAQNLTMLVVSRASQGVGGAIITPTVMSFVASLYAEGESRNRAMGLLGAIGGAGYALGLILGGLLTTTVGWRWVFYINFPIGAAVVAASLWALPETRREEKPINIPGAIVATLALALLTYTLSVSDPRNLLSLRMFTLAAASAGLFYLCGRVCPTCPRNSPSRWPPRWPDVTSAGSELEAFSPYRWSASASERLGSPSSIRREDTWGRCSPRSSFSALASAAATSQA